MHPPRASVCSLVADCSFSAFVVRADVDHRLVGILIIEMMPFGFSPTIPTSHAATIESVHARALA